MEAPPSIVFLDTNVYILGAADTHSPEASILQWAGFGQHAASMPEVVVSSELFEQISRVARRLRHKDWGSEILGHIWRDLRLRYVLLEEADITDIEASGLIPREDISVYLTARTGQAECFVSANHELVRALTQITREFTCFTPQEFVNRYLS